MDGSCYIIKHRNSYYLFQSLILPLFPVELNFVLFVQWRKFKKSPVYLAALSKFYNAKIVS